ncbi:MAG: molybdenum cofactor guanylyltransferase MobA [Thioalkalispiraceae bacterium]
MIENNHNIGIVVLAGGRAERMTGQNKGLIELAGKPLISHVLDKLRSGKPGATVKNIVISANSDLDRYQSLGYPVVEDSLSGQLGPLCGMYSAMNYLNTEWLLTVPCDVPLLPDDYLQRMLDHDGSAQAYVAFDGERQHSGCCLLHHSLQSDLLSHLEQQQLAVHRFLKEHHAQQIDFSDEAEEFANINTAEQLALLQSRFK